MRANGLHRPHEVVVNIVNTELFKPATDAAKAKAHLGLPKHVVTHMGRLSYEKSVDRVLHAFGRIAKEDSESTLIVAGDGPEKAELESLAKTLKLERNIRFTGFIHGAPLVEYLQASEVFVTASKSENMPLAMLEAMAAGLPIVAVRSRGLTEIVEDGKNGYLVAPDDVPEIAKRIGELFRDADLQRSMGARSRELSTAYTETAVSEKLEGVYSRLPGRPRR
jgi:1,2-diacylglycerol 3-alpha-glucosyltransferase